MQEERRAQMSDEQKKEVYMQMIEQENRVPLFLHMLLAVHPYMGRTRDRDI